ncbi:hypothetical protein FGB62_229g012 [Gracilaria domingensis]|nr:hypothetical protein FGB62_229g012 [Gracilaria domingensis]
MTIGAIDFTPQHTLSTFQFQSEALNTVVTSLILALIIANFGSVVNRLIFLSDKNVLSYRSLARSHVFLNSDDVLKILYWVRGRYDFQISDHPPAQHKLCRSLLIVPLCARVLILVVNIGSIALALPSEKRLDACSRGDYALVQRLPETPFTLGEQEVDIQFDQPCTRIPLEASLGTVRSSASYCSVRVALGVISAQQEIVSLTEERQSPGYIAFVHVEHAGEVGTLVASNGTLQTFSSFVQWNTENEQVLNSVWTSFDPETHRNVVVQSLRLATQLRCNVIASDRTDTELGVWHGTFLDCAFNANQVQRYASAGVRESMSFRKESGIAPRAWISGPRRGTTESVCAVDITATGPLTNIIPLTVALVVMFGLNMAIRWFVSQNGNVTDAAFHLAREILGHECGANPLQMSASGAGVKQVELQYFECADGVSAHVGFLKGSGCEIVKHFSDGRILSRCTQVGCRGSRFVEEASPGGNESVK